MGYSKFNSRYSWTFLFLAPYIGIVLSITAVVFYAVQKKHEATGMATGGLVTGIIGIILNGIMLIFVIGALAFIGAVDEMTSETSGEVTDTRTNIDNPKDSEVTAEQDNLDNPKIGEVSEDVVEPEEDKIACPNLVKTTTYEFKWGTSIEGNENLYLYADFLKAVTFSGEWKLSNLPSSNEWMRDSFYCDKGSKAGESVNKLYCQPTWEYEPKLERIEIDSDGNIVKTDYQYIKSFVFDIKDKDIENAVDLKDLKMETITCSLSSW